MNIKHLTAILRKRYGPDPDYPWQKFPDYAVFRHPHNRKWFCLLARVPADKLGLPGTDMCEIANIKTRPEWVGPLRTRRGILPAYHMNKEHWLTLLLAEMEENDVLDLIGHSFELTR
ncbi:putative DNA-binding protein (MmcQ/YjbR family) [Neisseria sp. HSC-16F19]|nr:MmcQ/YjbR family DNA-binding protein [Neisseria sp. HSC-16F19]MCP2040620.1 putative DNA-binding protein (MmcQ/YjbR family) [Neisseria sp. HSC-16F19]